MRGRRTGFTLIELMMAMTCLSILLIAIATVTMQVTHLYDKGQTIKMINQSGRQVMDSIRRDARTTGTLSERFIAPSDGNGLGRLCLGSVSYVWNDAADLQDPTKGVSYMTASGSKGNKIVLARVQDVGGGYCHDPTNVNVPESQSTEMLKGDGRDLAIYRAKWKSMSPAGGIPQLYLFSFTLGTNEAQTVKTSDLTCQPPDQANSNFDFCSINDFEILLSVG